MATPFLSCRLVFFWVLRVSVSLALISPRFCSIDYMLCFIFQAKLPAIKNEPTPEALLWSVKSFS